MDCKDNLGYLLNKAAKMTKWDLTNRMSEYGITSTQWSLLKDIFIQQDLCSNEEERRQKLTPAAIAERLHADRPTISGMLERLVKQGWIYRVSNPKDRRSQIILVTDKTKEIIPKLDEMSYRTVDEAIKDFSEQEVQQLKQYLKRIIDNLVK